MEITESEANKMIFDTLSAKFGTINNNKISSNDSLDGDFADSDIDEKNYEDFVHEKDGDEDNEIEVEKKSKKVDEMNLG